MKKRSERLDVVQQVAARTEQERAQRVGEAERHLAEMQDKLTALEKYRAEYETGFATRAGAGVDVIGMRDFQTFLAKLARSARAAARAASRSRAAHSKRNARNGARPRSARTSSIRWPNAGRAKRRAPSCGATRWKATSSHNNAPNYRDRQLMISALTCHASRDIANSATAPRRRAATPANAGRTLRFHPGARGAGRERGRSSRRPRAGVIDARAGRIARRRRWHRVPTSSMTIQRKASLEFLAGLLNAAAPRPAEAAGASGQRRNRPLTPSTRGEPGRHRPRLAMPRQARPGRGFGRADRADRSSRGQIGTPIARQRAARTACARRRRADGSGEPSRLMSAIHAGPMNSARASRSLVRAGESQAALQLTPVDLGPVDVTVTVRDSQATIHFGAAQAETRALIEASLPKLREMLAAQGFQSTRRECLSGFHPAGSLRIRGSAAARNRRRSARAKPVRAIHRRDSSTSTPEVGPLAPASEFRRSQPSRADFS